jgi:queuine tRNA-ribosyltransferase
LHADQARFEEATFRTTRWLDRCMKANRKPDKQNLFPIVQGGFDVQLRETSMQQVRAGPCAGHVVANS